jgi:hypothetical protein
MKVQDGIPTKPGYYWAKWRIPSDDTPPECFVLSDTWEIVQVNANQVDWADDPMADEALSVMVPGVQQSQWRDCFVWGDFVAPLDPK